MGRATAYAKASCQWVRLDASKEFPLGSQTHTFVAVLFLLSLVEAH
jgi:hypothetical protein